MSFPYVRYLSDDGTTTGDKNANGNYSGAPEEFYVEATTNMWFGRLMVSFEDGGGMQAQEYGNLNTALTNGVEFEIRNEYGDVMSDLTDGVPIKTNAQLAQLVGPDVDRKDWGGGNDLMIARWTFSKFSDGIALQPGWKFVAKLNDNFSGLVTHRFNLQGKM